MAIIGNRALIPTISGTVVAGIKIVMDIIVGKTPDEIIITAFVGGLAAIFALLKAKRIETKLDTLLPKE